MVSPLQNLGPMDVYGSKISYYTGKLEAYLRYRGVAYQNKRTVGDYSKLKKAVGVVQMPVVQFADGRWATDTTPLIAWMETQQDEPSIYPEDRLLNFLALLIEDYADEWLWRPAMHYRWTYRQSREYAAQFLYNELVKGVLPLPRFLALNMLKRRQYFGFVWGDGVKPKGEGREHADQTYLTALEKLETIFEKRDFLLGDRPSIADFGMMAPMFRHFAEDPYPAEIMREKAPAVYEWVARMWRAEPSKEGASFLTEPDEALWDFVSETCETNLAQHRQNAENYDGRETRYDLSVQGKTYKKVPISRYRVWCLEELRRLWAELDDAQQGTLKEKLPEEASILWDDTSFKPSGYDAHRQAPFNKAINVYAEGMPKR